MRFHHMTAFRCFPMLSGPLVLSHFTEANAEVRWRPFSSLLLWEFPRAWHQCNYFGTFGRTKMMEILWEGSKNE